MAREISRDGRHLGASSRGELFSRGLRRRKAVPGTSGSRGVGCRAGVTGLGGRSHLPPCRRAREPHSHAVDSPGVSPRMRGGLEGLMDNSQSSCLHRAGEGQSLGSRGAHKPARTHACHWSPARLTSAQPWHWPQRRCKVPGIRCLHFFLSRGLEAPSQTLAGHRASQVSRGGCRKHSILHPATGAGLPGHPTGIRRAQSGHLRGIFNGFYNFYIRTYIHMIYMYTCIM